LEINALYLIFLLNTAVLWKLTVDITKPQVLIFSKHPMTKRDFLYDGVTIEKVKQFFYLGTREMESLIMQNTFNRASFKGSIGCIT
jgi:hypothetical protein